MNRATRRRATRLKAKGEQELEKLSGDELKELAIKLDLEQYLSVLSRFESNPEQTPGELASEIAREVRDQTQSSMIKHLPRLIPETKMREINCSTGCNWCCHQPVRSSILDAVSVAQAILAAGDEGRFGERIAEYESGLSETGNRREALQTNHDPCPFLGDQGLCEVYEVRPIICRAFHSTDVSVCKRKFSADGMEGNVPLFPGLFGFAGLKLGGARRALSELGFDDRPVLLATAVRMLLDDFEGVVERWLNGEGVFDPAAIVEE